MTKKWSGTRSEPLKTKRQASKQVRRALDRWDEITPEQVAKIDELVAPEFATGDWQTVEEER